MTERPSWCERVDCPVYPGDIKCNLEEAIRREHQPLPRRILKKEFERVEKLSQEDPEEVVNYCLRKI